MRDQKENPFLPPAPADGKHIVTDGIGRCKACGAYSGSPEAQGPCKGRYVESAKMRAWAATEWEKALLLEGGPARKIVQLVRRQPASVAVGRAALFSTVETCHLLLECGHERTVTLEQHRAAAEGLVSESACLTVDCPMAMRDDFLKLNPGFQMGTAHG
jgi:FKBP-type peptidyl-prolyl cis-trans isomerase 2